MHYIVPSPSSPSPPGPHVGGASVKMMQEMIPMAYEELRCKVDSLQEELWKKREPPIMSRDSFWYIHPMAHPPLCTLCV